jgi:hypothetical protein
MTRRRWALIGFAVVLATIFGIASQFGQGCGSLNAKGGLRLTHPRPQNCPRLMLFGRDLFR